MSFAAVLKDVRKQRSKQPMTNEDVMRAVRALVQIADNEDAQQFLSECLRYGSLINDVRLLLEIIQKLIEAQLAPTQNQALIDALMELMAIVRPGEMIEPGQPPLFGPFQKPEASGPVQPKDPFPYLPKPPGPLFRPDLTGKEQGPNTPTKGAKEFGDLLPRVVGVFALQAALLADAQGMNNRQRAAFGNGPNPGLVFPSKGPKP